MKVVCVNGSPHTDGNTYLTIKAFTDELHKNNVESEVIHVGGGDVSGCIACGGCVGSAVCTVPDEQFKEWSDKLKNADGVFLAAPVYFGTMPGHMKSFLDRFFFQCIQGGKMRLKVGASAAILRRTGGYTTLDDLNRYFFSSEMIIVSASCPNIVHGRLPGEVLRDIEGMDAITKLARNMAWILKMIDATKTAIEPPQYSKKVFMSFIRE